MQSKKNTVYQWEIGRCIPKLTKLIYIAMYFGISLDCLLYGRAVAGCRLEKLLSASAELPEPSALLDDSGVLLRKMNALPSQQRERLIGYVDALCRDNRADGF